MLVASACALVLASFAVDFLETAGLALPAMVSLDFLCLGSACGVLETLLSVVSFELLERFWCFAGRFLAVFASPPG